MNQTARWCAVACVGLAFGATGEEPTPPEPHKLEAPPNPAMREVFPGVRVDLAKRVVEFDGMVPINARTKADLKVFLETTVCGYDSKEHESLVVTRAKPSHVHASLLMLGLRPGKPGAWKQEARQWVGIPAEGDEVEVTIVTKDADGKEREEDPAEWIVNVRDGKSLKQLAPEARWVFAGSKLARSKPSARAAGEGTPAQPLPADRVESKTDREYYVADTEGTLVGLTSFGTETIGLTVMYNPDNDKSAPEWIASREKVPEIGTKVLVRVRPTKAGG